MSVWEVLIGQDEATATLSHAAADAARSLRGEPAPGMTHAWLITGPPGSGRSTAATAFAAALVCSEQGCGDCIPCRTAIAGTHSDVEIVRPEGLSYGADDTEALVMQASMAPSTSRWHIIVVEDADRLTEQALNRLLKALEEPAPSTVWILCAPGVEDVLPTVRSRTRHVSLRTPSASDVATALQQRHGVDAAIAAFAARASQGHIGRARALATDEQARLRRHEVLRLPLELHDLSSCFVAAADLLAAATGDATALADPLDAREEADLLRAYGEGADNASNARAKKLSGKAMKDLQKSHKSRRTRMVRDQIDRALLDLVGFYRDVLILQVQSDVGLINEEMRTQLSQVAVRATPEDTARRLKALAYARLQIAANVTPQLALEALMVRLKDPSLKAA
ncbi:MAG: DNA polymerase III subunit delta' [Actinobacteria bacterium]|nr:DNA polymerase III subunit delta' [Actinomycetota bacterium]